MQAYNLNSPSAWYTRVGCTRWKDELRRKTHSKRSSVTVQSTVILIGKPNYWYASADVTMIVTSNDLTTNKHCSIQTTDIQHLIISIIQTWDNYCFTFHCYSLNTDYLNISAFFKRWSVFEWAVLESSAVLRKQQQIEQQCLSSAVFSVSSVVVVSST